MNTPNTPPPRDNLISHGTGASAAFDERLQAIGLRLRTAGDHPSATVERQLQLLDELAGIELGRFLLEHRGLDAYWTHRVVTHLPGGQTASPMERWLLEQAPSARATRERFGIFRSQLQALLRPGAVMASVPCGLMGELLLLEHGPDVRLIGIDLDQQALDGARKLAEEHGLTGSLTLRREDAWALTLKEEADVLASNGLNVYEPDDTRVVALYRTFFDALKPGGTLVTSFLTPPPVLSPESPWSMAEIDPEALAFQQLVFMRIIEAKWNAFRTHAQTRAQLEEAGFTDIRFIDDRARLFPTVVASKPA
ncbi:MULTISPECIES: SAM-dependent methyltransferase [Pseudomonadaceae]|uniref:Ubiquinone/menaquinone biosynthesis C-methylase UbiE n=1 Tax=Pseudomonas indica TaxID=137658 RepID=A0A1G8VMB3_9PSED|nr:MULTISPECIES: class I SAM-dependent methyltransferase [Pseudomonas]PAU63573.1 SAM-dependent methyltransferase [Pseudomonas indica]SDJ67198.1 Ubiquinone/menaquinone biosynthesis C-methylase UbiE [Pseudomonas indica]